MAITAASSRTTRTSSRTFTAAPWGRKRDGWSTPWWLGSCPKVKHPVLTAVCRSGLDRVAALDPGGSAAVDVLDVGIAQLDQVAGRRQAALAAVADGEHRAITRHLRYPLLQLAQRNQPRAGHMPGRVLPGFSHVQQERLRFHFEALPHLIDVNSRNSCHRGILTAAWPSAGMAGASLAATVRRTLQREQGPAVPAIPRLRRAQAAPRRTTASSPTTGAISAATAIWAP